MIELPPEQLPPLDDPVFGGPGPYASSDLRDVCGTRINPDAIGWYKRRHLIRLPTCPAKTCAHPELDQWLGDVGSYDPRAAVTQPALSEWPFSAICPRIVVWGQELAFPLEPATYVIDYPYLHSNPQTLPAREWVLRLRDRFPDGSRLLLSFFGNRALTLGLWTLTDFWYHPFLDQFDGVILPDFSAFSDDPVPQYLLGERMQQIFAQEGSEAGRAVVPSIAWSSETSLRRQVELWTSRAPRVNTIQLDCYGSNVDRTGWIWRWLFALEKYCAGKPYIRWLISGITAGWAIRELNRIFPEKNYCLIPSVSMFVSSTKGTTDKEFMGLQFSRRMRQLEAFRRGEEVADPLPRPDAWPTFTELRRGEPQ
jgi:hypothetical protein